MENHIIHAVIDALNASETHIGYAAWFSSPDFASMLMFCTAALIATVHLMPMGKKD
ncbi:hypothetical protein OMR58_25715 [Erwinia sp. INIA-01]|uniref:hypothetical protein n=1 Tax=Erwinia sp. INIA01 TaxID=2991500 RepID=UPI002224FB7C|nr:hypothetical protein [Erwinia sp. INIA01]MCW1877838.1 hypothetical protein [Erwinia sp. INIA01]